MATVYRFLPYTRRGLAAALPDGAAAGGDLDQHPEITVGLVVAGAGQVDAKTRLSGPGDVIGLDPTQIVRIYPRPDTTNAEPNYLAAVDLDAPELPWLFTPRGVPEDGRLPPWLVLVVVEDRQGVSVSVPAGAPLPQLRIDSDAHKELPDLAGSWAWAHTQLVEPSGGVSGAAAVASALAAQPDRAVSRLVCPRRLAPDRRWIAAIVPAFDVGRIRGLGGIPAPDAKVRQAWEPGQSTVTLPAYFHWTFQTGPEGDFEALAQRLRPHKADTRVGLVAMHVGDGAPPIRVPQDQQRIMDMDGALRAPSQVDGTLEQVPEALRSGLKEVTRTLADAADGVLDGQAHQDASRQPVGPPVYASAHVRRWRVLDWENPQDAAWFREVNLDPRSRVAAGLGAECVRRNQEDIANAAWRQVGDLIAAQAALQLAALAELVGRAFHRRHVVPLGDAALISLVAPAAARLPVAGRSLTAAVAATSLPDAVIDPGLRRALTPAGRAVARASRRVSLPASQVRPTLVAVLAQGREDLDATRFPRPVLGGVHPEALTGGDLSGIGLPIDVGREAVEHLAKAARQIVDTPVDDTARLAIRPQVREFGMVSQANVEAARLLADRSSESITQALAGGAEQPQLATLAAVTTGAMIDQLAAFMHASTAEGGSGVGFLAEGPSFQPGTTRLAGGRAVATARVLDIDAGNTLVVRGVPGGPNTPVAVLDQGLAGRDLTGVLSRLPRDVIRLRDPGAPIDRGDLPVLRRGGPVGLDIRGAGIAFRDRPPDGVPISRAGISRVLRTDVATPAAGPQIHRPLDVGLPLDVGHPVVIDEPRVARSGLVALPAGVGASVVIPPLVKDPAVLARLETALARQQASTVIGVPAPRATPVAFDLQVAGNAIRAHTNPRVAQPLLRDAALAFAGKAVAQLQEEPFTVDGWWSSRQLDRIMAYPTFPVAAAGYLSDDDPGRFCPGVDTIPADSVTLLETNPRFIAAFMTGLNHETNRELLWRGFPTDSRGTPFRRFWRRLDGGDDITPIHGWRTGTLAQQTSDPQGNLVLLIRGDLLRRYPNTTALAMPAIDPRTPDHDTVIRPIFADRFDPDVSYFGFPLVDADLERPAGYFFALMEPVTEPRFGLDETRGGRSAGHGGNAADMLAWTDTRVDVGGHLDTAALGRLGLSQTKARADDVAGTFFQRPFALYVHSSHLVPKA